MNRPELELYLNLWLFCIHTALWRDSINQDSRDYVMVFFSVLGREVFKFRLYETGMSRWHSLDRQRRIEGAAASQEYDYPAQRGAVPMGQSHLQNSSGQ